MNKKRILAVDAGDARSGIAVSDPTGFLASGILTIKCTGLRVLAEKITELCREYDAEKVILGYPVNMNGTRGDRCARVEALRDMIISASDNTLTVELFDERMTTMAAHRILNETDTRGKKRKGIIDTMSAQIILQNYLDRNR